MTPVCVAQLLGSPLTPPLLTRTSSSPTTTWRWLAAAMTTGWCWVTLPSPVASTTGRWPWIATTTTRTQPLGSPGAMCGRTWCWGRTTRHGPCTWTTIALGSCTTTRTLTGERWSLLRERRGKPKVDGLTCLCASLQDGRRHCQRIYNRNPAGLLTGDHDLPHQRRAAGSGRLWGPGGRLLSRHQHQPKRPGDDLTGFCD